MDLKFMYVLLTIIFLGLIGMSFYAYNVEKEMAAYRNQIKALETIQEEEGTSTVQTLSEDSIQDFDGKKLQSNEMGTLIGRYISTCYDVRLTSEGTVYLTVKQNVNMAADDNKFEFDKPYVIENISGTVKDVYISLQAGSHIEKVVFIMEDGSLQYLITENILNDGEFKAEKISALSDIVKCVTTNVISGDTIYLGIFAIANDGAAYELPILK